MSSSTFKIASWNINSIRARVEIVEKFLRQLEEQLADRGVTIEVTQAAKDLLREQGYDPQNGARPLDRVIREKIKRPLADDLLFGRLEKGGHLIVDAQGEAFHFKFPDKAEPQKADEAPPAP